MAERETAPPPPPSPSPTLAFLNSLKLKMLVLLFDGFMSGLLMGIVIMAVVISAAIGVPLPTNGVIALLFAMMISVGLFVWGIHKAFKEKG